MNSPNNPRRIVFIALMAALGNVMFVISQTIFKAGQIALDLSHIGTFIAAIYGGPWLGFLTGFMVGVGPGMYFGYLGGSLGLLGLIGLPVGKALTGLTTGYLARILRIDSTKHPSWKIPVATLTGYIPEALFTILFFESFVPLLIPDVAKYLMQAGSMSPFLIPLMAKAWIEIAILTVFMGALVGNNGFNDFVKVFTKPYAFSKLKAHQSN
jgi:thiamine transporter ThiT